MYLDNAVKWGGKMDYIKPGLGISPEYFKKDIDYFGHVFEKLIVICANASMSYITENGVIVLPVGCIRD